MKRLWYVGPFSTVSVEAGGITAMRKDLEGAEAVAVPDHIADLLLANEPTCWEEEAA